jgi:hypothetical protein
VVEEIAVALLFEVISARNDVDGDAAVAELVECRRLARGECRRHESRAVYEKLAKGKAAQRSCSAAVVAKIRDSPAARSTTSLLRAWAGAVIAIAPKVDWFGQD